MKWIVRQTKISSLRNFLGNGRSKCTPFLLKPRTTYAECPMVIVNFSQTLCEGKKVILLHFFHRTFEFSGLSHAWINQLFARKRIREKKFDHLLSPVTQHYAKANPNSWYYSMNAPIGVTLIGVWCKFRIHEWSHIFLKSQIQNNKIEYFANRSIAIRELSGLITVPISFSLSICVSISFGFT